MRPLIPFATAALLALGAAAVGLRPHASVAHPEPARPPPSAEAPVVQLALLLDTSSSMDGLLDQARTQLWRVVNEFNSAHRDGRAPRLQIALYEYGKDTVPAERGYIRQVLPFTDDLDRLSEELFKLTTNGGEEYCGQAIQTATRQLAWSERPDALKVLFIAGNEPFSQGHVSFASAIREAAAKGIVVNTVYCGDAGAAEAAEWRAGAQLGRGRFLAIDQSRVVQEDPAPQDQEIARLGVELNQTYLAYGEQGQASQARQQAQDTANAQFALGNAIGRAVSKANGNYNNEGWDLVDAYKQHRYAQVQEAQLPAELRGLSPAEREAKVKEKLAQREALQTRINQLSRERAAFLAQRRAKSAQAGAGTLDAAVTQVVREEAAQQRYVFE